LALWLAGLPTGLYLNYWARPTFGLNGVWYGLILGAGLQLVIVSSIYGRTDWKQEALLAVARKDRNFFRSPLLRKFRKSSSSSRRNIDESRREDAVGTSDIQLVTSLNWTEEGELQEMERMIDLQESHRVGHDDET
jgi:hypothetical protein